MCRQRSRPGGDAGRGQHVALVDVEHVRVEPTRGNAAANSGAWRQCVVARRPSSSPAAARANAPVQIETLRPGASRKAVSTGRRELAQRVLEARHHDRVGLGQRVEPALGDDVEADVGAHRPGAIPHSTAVYGDSS